MKPLKIISIIAVTLMCWEAGGRLVIFLFQTGLEDWQLQQSTGQWTYVLSSISI